MKQVCHQNEYYCKSVNNSVVVVLNQRRRQRRFEQADTSSLYIQRRQLTRCVSGRARTIWTRQSHILTGGRQSETLQQEPLQANNARDSCAYPDLQPLQISNHRLTEHQRLPSAAAQPMTDSIPVPYLGPLLFVRYGQSVLISSKSRRGNFTEQSSATVHFDHYRSDIYLADKDESCSYW